MAAGPKDSRANVAGLLAQAQKPAEQALRLHPYYRGKLEVTPKCAIHSCEDFAVWYSPGVAKNVLTQSALIENATRFIRRAQQETKVLMKEGVIAPIPGRS